MVVKRGIWTIMITTDWMLCGIIPFAEFLVVAGVKVCHVFCFTVKLCLCHMVDQNIILFWKKKLNCVNNIIRTLAVINKWKLGLFLSKYLLFLQLTLMSVTSTTRTPLGSLLQGSPDWWRGAFCSNLVYGMIDCMGYLIMWHGLGVSRWQVSVRVRVRVQQYGVDSNSMSAF